MIQSGILQSGTLQERLLRFAMLVVGVACLVITLLELTGRFVEEQEKLHHDIDLLLDVTADAVQPYVVFNDAKGASSHLNGLLRRPDILGARLTGQDGLLIAEVMQAATSRMLPRPTEITLAHTAPKWFLGESVLIRRAISLDQDTIGAIEIHFDLKPLWQSQLAGLGRIALSMLIAIAVAHYIARRLKGMIIGPIADIDRAAREITASRQYAVRVQRTTDDEIGHLADRFNAMLAEIQNADEEIRRRSVELETQKGVLTTLINTMPDLIWLKDPQGAYLACNARFERLLGVPEAAILGKTDYDFIDRERADRFRANDLRAIEKGEKSVNEEWLTFADDAHRELAETTKVPMFGAEGGLIGVLGIGHDITERKRTEDELRQAASVFEFANEGITITDPGGRILDVNDGFTRITGYTRDEVIGENPRLLKSDRHGPDFYQALWTRLNSDGNWSGEIWNRRKGGQIYVELLTISAVRDKNGELLRYVGLFSDITEIKEHQKQLERLAHFDTLTGLPNRTLLSDRLYQAIARAERSGNMLAVVFLDLDGFKAINDEHGHDVGDQLLGILAARMKESLRELDTLARLGGDEFVAVLLDLPNHEASAPILERLLEAAARPAVCGEFTLKVSASIGVTFFPQSEQVDADQLMRQADQAMYEAKRSGKNRFQLFDAEHERSVRGQRESVERIREALAHDEFVLYYQPKVNMRSGKVIGAEALIRWQHPERGLLPPGAFLPAIEGNPVMVNIGEWVLDTALRQVERWRRQGLVVPVSVNIDAQQLEDKRFVSKLVERLVSYPDTKPGDLELEVLETSALNDIERVSEVMHACHEIGVNFALDDFGTGYSSLNYLKRLPARLLKIDQSFVRDMLDDPEDLVILEGVLGLAAAFQRDAIAEGVETIAHGRMLLQMGCELGQGYAIAKPMPAAAVSDWVAGWRPDPSWTGSVAINRDDLPILFAEVEHRAWVAGVKRYLHAEQPMPALDIHQCRFGHWLDTIGETRYADHPGRGEITSLHEKIHRQAKEIIDLKRRGYAGLAQSRAVELEELRDKLVVRLETWLS